MSDVLARLASGCDVAGALQIATAVLAPNGRLDAELLLGAALGLDRIGLLRERTRVLSEVECARLRELISQRRRGVPVAYLLGLREFWSLTFIVDSRVLIPRPETEGLVEVGCELAARAPAGPIADLGTGSGAVAVALARECAERPVLALDASRAALAVAQLNVARLAVGRVDLVNGDWLAGLAPDRFALIVSNPPYVEDDFPDLATAALGHEPRAALAAGADGLDDLRRIVPDARRCLQAGGWLALEHGASQGPAVRALLAGAGFTDIDTRRDFAALERISLGRRPVAAR